MYSIGRANKNEPFTIAPMPFQFRAAASSTLRQWLPAIAALSGAVAASFWLRHREHIGWKRAALKHLRLLNEEFHLGRHPFQSGTLKPKGPVEHSAPEQGAILSREDDSVTDAGQSAGMPDPQT
jgi:hypothetical protein